MLFLLAAAALAASPAASDGQGDSRASLIAFADAFDRAQLAKDASALEAMVSDDLIFIDGSGVRRDKRAFIASWTTAGDRYQPITLVDRTVTLIGKDAGIVGAEVTLQGSSNGTPFLSRFRFSDTFRKTKGRWRAIHIQVTRLPPGRPPEPRRLSGNFQGREMTALGAEQPLMQLLKCA